MKPYVVLHIGMSLDGRIDWSRVKDSPFYDLVSSFRAGADLSGSATMLKAFLPENPQGAFPGAYETWMAKPAEERGLLAVVDSRGQVRSWDRIRKQPWWRGSVALCSEATPPSHIAYLQEQQVPTIVAGTERVDLDGALKALNEKFGVKKVRVDSGGILNGALLRAGLVNEVSVIFNPELVGGESPKTMFVAPDLSSAEGVIGLKLVHLEKLKEDYVWVRYQLVQ